MLTGNSAAFTFLVNAETEPNEYVASRPFRINAGAVHAYALMPGDRTAYLEELRPGGEVLIADHEGACQTAVVGRIKVERRPMLLVRARAGDAEGAVFLQNAETIRLVRPGGKPASVVGLAPGDTILCRLDEAGRHFGMRIKETIREE
jgi:3-dehydroquinate synthase II